MTSPRLFHIGDVLSITSGVLLSPRGLTGVKELLSYMTEEDLSLYELTAAAEACAPILRAQFPTLAAEFIPKFDHSSEALAWLESLESVTGYESHVTVTPATRLPVFDSGL
jgi:hypothetical protein